MYMSSSLWLEALDEQREKRAAPSMGMRSLLQMPPLAGCGAKRVEQDEGVQRLLAGTTGARRRRVEVWAGRRPAQ